ncbi:MAG TPA: carbamoyltransferase HypF [Anaerolineales bacterium]
MRGGAHVRVTGIVQGVGFRPFIFNLANRFGLAGWVRNTSAGVEIEVDGATDVLQAFARAIEVEAPPLSRIDQVEFTLRPAGDAAGFEIRESASVPEAFQAISPDVAVCPDCLRELIEPGNRRFRYPFINCTNCGPRFTIIKDIPYDRPLTTMAGFPMCPDCQQEYRNPRDRRFHAQPIACPACGPQIWLEVNGHVGASAHVRGEEALSKARSLLSEGKIVALKGLGGFHLACDATNSAAVSELRRRKLRVDKPFAVMVSHVDEAKYHCFVSHPERQLLESVARPIVLLQRGPDCRIVEEVAPGQGWIGVMLPYTPLHYLLLEQSAGMPPALVMTSGNVSEEPIAFDNAEAREHLSDLADAFLMHDRDIHVRCDDSVVRLAPPNNGAESRNIEPTATYPLRRSRGYAPFPIRLPWHSEPVLAVGAELKNTFCLVSRNFGFMSHHIGDLENYKTLVSFETGVRHFESLFRAQPRLIAHDLHPDYLSTRYAHQRADREGIQTLAVQHHHAHVASCMAEHQLSGASKVIGIALDGTGFGTDGAIWGGEFLVADYDGFERSLHLQYFPLPGGDSAIKRPARTALALLWSIGVKWDDGLAAVQDFSAVERENLQIQLERSLNAPLTSSMGRLFDAASSLAGIRQRVNYEAQAAIEFEAIADSVENEAYPFRISGDVVEVGAAFAALVQDVQGGTPAARISARFHNGVAGMVASAAVRLRDTSSLNNVVLSGGVWQNITLLRRTLSLLQKDDFQVYLHREVPTNDGGLSLGQAAIATARLRAGNVPGSSGTNNRADQP